MVSKHALWALMGVAVLPFVAAADSDRVTVLLPCGDAKSASAHAILPDGGCQKISDTGSFSLLALRPDPHTKLGFSNTPDCKLTYTPSYDELAKIKAGSHCITYVTGSTQAGGSDKDAAKATPDQQQQQPAQQQQQDGNPTDLHRMHKRRFGSQDASSSKLSSAANSQNAPLNYVMLVVAQDTIG